MWEDCDVAIVGAGPAGCMAAWGLASAGVDVAIFDRAGADRDKVCGDALLPDAVQALEEAALADEVRAEALAPSRLIVRSPGGWPVEIGGRFLTIRRRRFDAILARGAIAAGARLYRGITVVGPAGGCEPGHALEARERDREPVRIRARITVLACGSNPRLLQAFGMLTRPEPSATAIRAYLPHDPFAARRLVERGGGPEPDEGPGESSPALVISFERSLLPGYGWAFPLPGGHWNVGCGVFYPNGPRLPFTRRHRAPDLRRLLARFLSADASERPRAASDSNWSGTAGDGLPRSWESFGDATGESPASPWRGPSGPAGDDLGRLRGVSRDDRGQSHTVPWCGSGDDGRHEPWRQAVRGATLRTGFTGSIAVRGGVILAGEALGLTLPLTGDGIGKAMQSGLLAARAIRAALDRSRIHVDLSPYLTELESRTRRTYRAYAAAQRWMRVPAVADLIARRAGRSPALRRLIEEIVAERSDPRSLLSSRGVLRAAFMR